MLFVICFVHRKVAGGEFSVCDKVRTRMSCHMCEEKRKDMHLTSRERVLNALSGKAVDHVPVVSVCQYATFEMMDQLHASWPEAHAKAEPMAKLAEGGASILNLDAVRVPYCQTIEAEALGATVKRNSREHMPSIDVAPYVIGDTPIFPEDFLEKGRVPEVIQAVKLLKEKVGEDKIVMGSIVGPFSIATSLLGIPPTLKASFRKPDSLVPYIELSEKVGELYAKALIEAGADVIVIEDMMASMDMISPKTYRNLVAPYEKELIDTISVPTILHICGKLDAIMVDIAHTGATAISVESAVNIPAAVAQFKEQGIQTPIIGAVHPMDVLLDGNKEDVIKAVKQSIADGVGLVSPGCAVPPDTRIEQLITMVEAAEKADD